MNDVDEVEVVENVFVKGWLMLSYKSIHNGLRGLYVASRFGFDIWRDLNILSSHKAFFTSSVV